MADYYGWLSIEIVTGEELSIELSNEVSLALICHISAGPEPKGSLILSMTRADLIIRLASSAAIGIKDAELGLTTVLESIGDGLAQGQRIELRGFGVFQRREHSARPARNPRTGKSVMVAAKATAHFNPGITMHKLLNGDHHARELFQAKHDAQMRRRDEKAG